MADGAFRELAHAASAAIEDDAFVCRNSRGKVLVSFNRRQVLAFSSRPWIGAMMLNVSLETRAALPGFYEPTIIRLQRPSRVAAAVTEPAA